jgi:hypothetical protein
LSGGRTAAHHNAAVISQKQFGASAVATNVVDKPVKHFVKLALVLDELALAHT